MHLKISSAKWRPFWRGYCCHSSSVARACSFISHRRRVPMNNRTWASIHEVISHLIVKSHSLKTARYAFRVFWWLWNGSVLRNITAEVPIKYHTNTMKLTSKLSVSKLDYIPQQDIFPVEALELIFFIHNPYLVKIIFYNPIHCHKIATIFELYWVVGADM